MDFYAEILKKLSGSQRNSYNLENYELSCLQNKRVLITGAAGSVGSNLSNNVALLNPSVLGLLDINESGLVELELEITAASKCETMLFLSDISNENTLRKVFNHFRPDIVFHTAAYKHVPVLEVFPEEAIRVNIMGTYFTARLAGEFNTEKFVLISTDKAVNPICVMGKSKNIAEKIVNKVRYQFSTNYIIVRFGNVIGSRGSASEIFLKQIKMGCQITLTHPEMKRYFMTLNEAVHLILTAAESGKDGNLFILDMDEPIYVIDLIEELIRANSYMIDKTPEIILTGIRNGEKLDEVLMTMEESIHAIYEDKFYRIDLNQFYEDTSNLLEMFKSFDNTICMKILNELFDNSFIPDRTMKKMDI